MTKLVKLGTYIRPPFDYGLVETEVAHQAQQAATRIRGHEKAAAVEIGRELVAMKEALGHGHFLPWLEAEFGYSNRTAQNLMQLATVFGDRYETVSHLPKAVQYALAAPSTSDAVRRSVLAAAPGHYVSPAEVKVALYNARKPKPVRLTQDERKAESARLESECRQDETRREREHSQAQDAVTFLIDRLGDDFAAFRAMVKGTTAHDLREAILAAAGV